MSANHGENLQIDRISADELRAFRARYGMRQRQLGEMLGVTVHTIQSWEHGPGTRGPTARLLWTIAALADGLPVRQVLAPFGFVFGYQGTDR